MSLKNKRILITAGPTWVPIDSVRVISNIATGETGVLLAEKLNNLGAKVTLLMGPQGISSLNRKIRLIHFKFFDELKNKIKQELKYKKYNIVIHSAAVSDYKPSRVYSGKIKSGIKNFRLSLVPTEKIIGLLKRIDNSIILVGFKFEPQAGKALLIKRTKGLIRNAELDLAVANTMNKNKYEAYIINQKQIYGPLYHREKLAAQLIKVMQETHGKDAL